MGVTPLKVLFLADDKPGHYHLTEGLIEALKRLRPVDVTRLAVQRKFFAPGRLLTQMVQAELPPWQILRFGYGLKPAQLPPEADLVVSAGGNTMAANIAAARALGAPNIFLGGLRRYQPENFTLVINSYQRFAKLPRHLIVPKPSKHDPDKLGRPAIPPQFGPNRLPKRIGLLLGGNSAYYRFEDHDWRQLIDFILSSHKTAGWRWLVSTSRRTPDSVADLLKDAAHKAQNQAISVFIDYRTAGPGTLETVFRQSDVILCTEDSSTMISEAIALKLPAIGLTPENHQIRPQEREYRRYLQSLNLTRTLPIKALSVPLLAATLAEIEPMRENHLDTLAAKLKARLPELF